MSAGFTEAILFILTWLRSWTVNIWMFPWRLFEQQEVNISLPASWWITHYLRHDLLIGCDRRSRLAAGRSPQPAPAANHRALSLFIFPAHCLLWLDSSSLDLKHRSVCAGLQVAEWSQSVSAVSAAVALRSVTVWSWRAAWSAVSCLSACRRTYGWALQVNPKQQTLTHSLVLTFSWCIFFLTMTKYIKD